MKAVVYKEYGPPEVLKLEEVARPTPKDNELLVRVRATTVNFGDLLARNFKNTPLGRFYMPLPLWLFARIAFGWNKPRVRMLGGEFSGVVESVGQDVKDFKKGDEVFGYPGQRMGAEDFTTNGEAYDVIYDILGKGTFAKCKNSLTDNGTYLNASFKSGKILQMIRTKVAGKKKVLCVFASEKHEDMSHIRDLAEAGGLRAIIDRTFPLEKAAEAHRYVEDGRRRGSVVITIAQGGQA